MLPGVIAVGGAGFAVLAGLDGSPAWQAGRVLTVVAVTALAVWFTRRAGRAGQGAAALLLGIAGTAAGLGVAAGHLTKAGPGAAAVAAAIAGTASLVLLIWGPSRWSGRRPAGGGCWPSRWPSRCCGSCCSR